MELLTPGIGLIFWQVVIFLALVFILTKFAWKPILNALKIREESIEEALSSAKKAKEEIENLKSDNEKLLIEARQEREKILKEAREASNELKEQAKKEAVEMADKIISDAKVSIESVKQAAMADVRNKVAELSLAITEKILRKKLESDKEQKNLMEEYLKDVKLN